MLLKGYLLVLYYFQEVFFFACNLNNSSMETSSSKDTVYSMSKDTLGNSVRHIHELFRNGND